MFKDYNTIRCNINDKMYTLWVADDQQKRSRGLSNLPRIAKDQGMIFIFDDLCKNSFTMRNTYFPLNILFLCEEHKIIEHQYAKAHQKEPVRPKYEYKYVIEIL